MRQVYRRDMSICSYLRPKHSDHVPCCAERNLPHRKRIFMCDPLRPQTSVLMRISVEAKPSQACALRCAGGDRGHQAARTRGARAGNPEAQSSSKSQNAEGGKVQGQQQAPRLASQ